MALATEEGQGASSPCILGETSIIHPQVTQYIFTKLDDWVPFKITCCRSYALYCTQLLHAQLFGVVRASCIVYALEINSENIVIIAFKKISYYSMVTSSDSNRWQQIFGLRLPSDPVWTVWRHDGPASSHDHEDVPDVGNVGDRSKCMIHHDLLQEVNQIFHDNIPCFSLSLSFSLALDIS